MNHPKVINHIIAWLTAYATEAKAKGFIVGISGGIDSAVVSYLCAKTGLAVLCVEMGIHQHPAEVNRALAHIADLEQKFSTVTHYSINLTEPFEALKKSLPGEAVQHELSMANTRARLRMTTLYAIGQSNGLLVVGTGNKIEDFGIGFYTKYGDGGVDLSPLADLTKTEVFALAAELGVLKSIQNAAPADGLWEDERTDEGQIGASYPELEWAMQFLSDNYATEKALTARQCEVLTIYQRFNQVNQHKMLPIPVCKIPIDLK